MKKHTRVWLGISLTSVLMTGTSLGGIYFYAENFEPPLYHEKYIVIDGDTLSRDVFAENIEENNEMFEFVKEVEKKYRFERIRLSIGRMFGRG